jgi:PPK2 family polyphosphate:nucleotide phosphotransferase
MPAIPKSPYLVPFKGKVNVKRLSTTPPKGTPDKAELETRLAECVSDIASSQKKLYADNRYSVLLVFQAMDAAGKDGTIRAVMTGTNPAATHVVAFKAPSAEELDHDFLWRVGRALPERGRIGIFNRSHYEEVLTVRVHPELLARQRLPEQPKGDKLWRARYQSIRDFEHHLARNGTLILKFWLNVSRGEQKKRLLARIDDPSANWKFEIGDVSERAKWGKYMDAYEELLSETSRPWAPWYAIPADSKGFMRWTVADIVKRALRQLDIGYPKLDRKALAELAAIRQQLADS